MAADRWQPWSEDARILAARELERFADRVRRHARDASAAAKRFARERRTSLHDHNLVRAGELNRLADIAIRRAKRLRKGTAP